MLLHFFLYQIKHQIELARLASNLKCSQELSAWNADVIVYIFAH